MLLCDTSGMLAYFDASDVHHAQVSEAIAREPGPFVVSAYVVAELDYLLGARRGIDAELVALAELGGGAWELPCLTARELLNARAVIDRYRDQELGIADASLVVLAERYRTNRVLTLDHRHFRVRRAPGGGPFELVPG